MLSAYESNGIKLIEKIEKGHSVSFHQNTAQMTGATDEVVKIVENLSRINTEIYRAEQDVKKYIREEAKVTLLESQAHLRACEKLREMFA